MAKFYAKQNNQEKAHQIINAARSNSVEFGFRERRLIEKVLDNYTPSVPIAHK
jgi:hypothetical protein